MRKKKKKKASKAVRTPEKPMTGNVTLDGKAIYRQVLMFEREFQKQNGRITDD